MICIKLLESWLPIPSPASLLLPLDIVISHGKETWTVYEYELMNCAVLSLITGLHQLKEPSSSSVTDKEIMLLLRLMLKENFTDCSGIILNSRLHLLFFILFRNN